MTKIEQTFDEFITAAAELAIKHVTTQVKTVLQGMTIYLVGQRNLEYNDEDHYFSGGMDPETFFLEKTEAEKFCLEQNVKGWWMDSNWREISDDNQEKRAAIAETLATAQGVSRWDITMREVYDHCIANKIDPATIMPDVYTIKELN